MSFERRSARCRIQLRHSLLSTVRLERFGFTLRKQHHRKSPVRIWRYLLYRHCSTTYWSTWRHFLDKKRHFRTSLPNASLDPYSSLAQHHLTSPSSFSAISLSPPLICPHSPPLTFPPPLCLNLPHLPLLDPLQNDPNLYPPLPILPRHRPSPFPIQFPNSPPEIHSSTHQKQLSHYPSSSLHEEIPLPTTSTTSAPRSDLPSRGRHPCFHPFCSHSTRKNLVSHWCCPGRQSFQKSG